MSGAFVFIDRSQFPENVRRDLLQSLTERAINHKFHYDSYKQATKWLALHEAYSPARTDPDCGRIYNSAFRSLLGTDLPARLEVIGAGCGGGQKEARLLEILHRADREVHYTAADASVPLVLTARCAAEEFLDQRNCRAVVCDLAKAEDLAVSLGELDEDVVRVVTLFGVIPNFEPSLLLSRIARVLRPKDFLLMSANLSVGPDYFAGVRAVQSQYDNELTREWLLTFLLDVGFERSDGDLRFSIETDTHQFCRITANFHLNESREVLVFGESIRFMPGERIRVFFSYRHTPSTVRSVLAEQKISILEHWENSAGDEGVFLCRRIGR